MLCCSAAWLVAHYRLHLITRAHILETAWKISHLRTIFDSIWESITHT